MDTQKLAHALQKVIQSYQNNGLTIPYQSLSVEECEKEITPLIAELRREVENAEREVFDVFFKKKIKTNIGLLGVLENFQKTRQATQRRVLESYSQHPNPRMAFVARVFIAGDYDLVTMFSDPVQDTEGHTIKQAIEIVFKH